MPNPAKHRPLPPAWADDDSRCVWHPYSAMPSSLPVYAVESASGVYLHLVDGRRLIDGMSSWWCAIHGYNVPQLNDAVKQQLASMAHVMFGGLTHEPAAMLARRLVELTPDGLNQVFFTDSGSVAVEVAMKMAIQYWCARGQPEKHRFVSLRSAYHGDTFGAMSVCDPVTGMHTLFSGNLQKNVFIASPADATQPRCADEPLRELEQALQTHPDIAALILEPIVQGAGGMKFYSAEYLAGARRLCDRYDVLLIADEIATGFGRTGKLFACEHAGISPDILCLGKSLTGGYMTLAATLTQDKISQTISRASPGVFMHGPTFMGNPLACRVALASIELLLSSPWQQRVQRIEAQLREQLAPCRSLCNVADVRVLGAIGVVETRQAMPMKILQPALVDAGVWVRPFGRLIYLMPPYIINDDELAKLAGAIHRVIEQNA